MKLVVIFCALTVMSAALIDDKVEVKSSYNEVSENSYKFGYDLTDNQTRAEEGKLVQVGDKKVLKVTGSYSFIGDDGSTYNVNYAADEKGYQPVIKVTKKSKIAAAMNVIIKQMSIISKKKSDLVKTLLG